MEKLKRGIVFLCLLLFILFSVGCDDQKMRQTEQQEYSYVLNTKSKKIHKTTCGTGAKIKPENRKEYVGDVSSLIQQGYTTCGNCF